MLCRYSSNASDGSGTSSEAVRRGRLSRLPRMSSTETPSGASPSTALDTRWQIGEHVGRPQLCARPQLDHDAAFGRLSRFHKDRIFGKGEVYPRLLHLGQRHHRTLQFPFERPAIIDVLGEFGGPEIRLVEQLEADAAALGKSGRRHAQPPLGDAVGGHHHRAAGFGETVRNTGFLQFLYDCAGVFGRHFREQRAEIRLALPAHQRVYSARRPKAPPPRS